MELHINSFRDWQKCLKIRLTGTYQKTLTGYDHTFEFTLDTLKSFLARYEFDIDSLKCDWLKNHKRNKCRRLRDKLIHNVYDWITVLLRKGRVSMWP